MESLDSKKNLNSDQSEAPEPPRPAPLAGRTLHETSKLLQSARHVVDNVRPEVISGIQEVEKSQVITQKSANIRAEDVEHQGGTWELPPSKEEEWTKVTSKKQPRKINSNRAADEKQQRKVKPQERCRAFIKGFCQFGNKCWHSHEKPIDKKVEVRGTKTKRVQSKLFDWNKELQKVLKQDPPAKYTPETDLLQRYQAIAMQPSIDLDTKIDLTEEQNEIVEAWFQGQIILEQPPYFLNQSYDVYQIAHIQAAFTASTQGLLRMPLQASMRVSPGLLHHAIMNSMKLPDSTEEDQKIELARFKDNIATSYVDHATNAIFFYTHTKSAAELWHGRYVPFQNRPTRLWNTAQGDPKARYQDAEDQESRQYHVKLVEVTANITPKHQLAMWEFLKIQIQSMTSRGQTKTRCTEASTVKVMFPTAFVPEGIKKITCLEWYETRGPTPARRRIYIEHYQLEKGNICPICLHAGHNMMKCNEEEDVTKKITLPNDFFSAMSIAQEQPTNWQSIKAKYQQEQKDKKDQLQAQIIAQEDAARKVKEQAEKAKKVAAATPSPIPNIKLGQTLSQEQETMANDDTCEYSHTSPTTNMEFHHVGPIDDILATTGRYVAKAVANGTCFSTAIMIAWRNKPLENPTKFNGAELEEIREVDKARMEAWIQAPTWKDLYKNAPFVPTDSSPEKVFKLTKAFFKAIIKPLATAGRKPQHYGSEADIYTASLAIGAPIYLFERHTTTTKPTQEYWTLTEYHCDAEEKTCFLLNTNKWKAILDSNDNHVIRYVNNNHYDAIPKEEEDSNDNKEDSRAIFLEEQKTREKPIKAAKDKNAQEMTPPMTQIVNTKPARQSTIQSFFTTITTKNQHEASRIEALKDSDDMDCATLEDERKRKREQRDYHDSADDMLEKISKGTRATNASANRTTLLRLTAAPTHHQDKENLQLENWKEPEVRQDRLYNNDPPENYHQDEEDHNTQRDRNRLENASLPSEVQLEPGSPYNEEVPTQYTDTLTWDNEAINSEWTEAHVQRRQQRFEAVSDNKIKDRQNTLNCNTQEAINDLFIEIHNDMMMETGPNQPSPQQSQLDDSDYIPSSQEGSNIQTQFISSKGSISQDTGTDREARLLATIKKFREERQGITKAIPENEAQVNEWCKRNITHLEELIHFTDDAGALLNLLSPDTLEEYGQLLIVEATVVWLAGDNKALQDSRIEAWYKELSNDGINIKMRYARATSRANWSGYNWDANQDMVNLWMRIPPKKRIKMAILTTLPAAMGYDKDNLIAWIAMQARNQSLTKLLAKVDWEAIAGMTPDKWQSLLQY